jgi:hypothetical protein
VGWKWAGLDQLGRVRGLVPRNRGVRTLLGVSEEVRGRPLRDVFQAVRRDGCGTTRQESHLRGSGLWRSGLGCTERGGERW